MSNQWGNGDVFSRELGPDDTSKIYTEQRININEPRTNFHKFMYGIWRAIAILGSVFVLLFFVTIVLGAFLGIISGIASVM